MEYIPQLARALDELKHITGLTLDVHVNTPEEMKQAAEQIRQLCSAYRSKYDREFFLQEMISGHIPPHDVRGMAERYHINPSEPRILFVLEANADMDGVAAEILKNLFPARNGSFLVPIEPPRRVAILQTIKKKDSQNTFRQTACNILDTLGTEALISAKIAYSRKLDHLDQIPAAFRECCTAIKIGTIFDSGQSIYSCGKLGIGQLICQLPLPVCENFLSEVFIESGPQTPDDDLLHTADAFFKNNLNIAETARQLHMHRNTLIYRLEQIEKNTGLDLRIFEDAILFKIASMILRYLQTERSN